VKRILHLYSNHKWTGPADHALNLVSWLVENSRVEAFFACGRRKDAKNQLRDKAHQRKVPLLSGLFLNKHLHWKIIPDSLALKATVARCRIDMIHSHQDNDALTAVLAGFGNRLIRTVYDGEPGPLNFRQRFCLHKTAKIMTASLKVQADLLKRFPEKEIEHVNIPVDLKTFCPSPKSDRLCREFGITTDTPVAGIVARVQKHKNFAMLLTAIEKVVKEIPDFTLLIVGRGTHIDSLARQPARLRGLDQNVIFTGYRQDDYRDVLNLFDHKIFLVPGSDGSCRAVREALACGKPVIASKKGILPELIKDGETGILIDDRPEDLAQAIITMVKEKDFRLRCGRAARSYAQNVLDPDRYLKKVLACYETLAT